MVNSSFKMKEKRFAFEMHVWPIFSVPQKKSNSGENKATKREVQWCAQKLTGLNKRTIPIKEYLHWRRSRETSRSKHTQRKKINFEIPLTNNKYHYDNIECERQNKKLASRTEEEKKMRIQMSDMRGNKRDGTLPMPSAIWLKFELTKHKTLIGANRSK